MNIWMILTENVYINLKRVSSRHIPWTWKNQGMNSVSKLRTLIVSNQNSLTALVELFKSSFSRMQSNY